MIRFSATVTVQYDTPFAPFTADRFGEAMDWTAACGFDGVELCIADYRDVDARKLKSDCAARGLGCSTISTGQARTREDISLLHADPAAQGRAVARLLEHIDAARILGSKVTLGLLRGPGNADRTDAQRAALARVMEPIVRKAEDAGVCIVLEAINRYETSLLNSAQDALEFIRLDLGDPPAVGILWDLFHANIEDPDFAGTIDRMGRKLQHVHLADSNRMFPGYGHVDFVSIYEQLERSGYDQYLSFECLNLPTCETVVREAKRFIDELRAGRRAAYQHTGRQT